MDQSNLAHQPQPLYKEHAAFYLNSKDGGHKQRRTILRVVFIVLALVLGFLAITGITYGTYGVLAFRSLTSAQKNVEAAKTQLASKQIGKAVIFLNAARDDLSAARSDLAKLTFLKVVPVLGNQYLAAVHLVNAVYVVDATIASAADAANQVMSALPSGDPSKTTFNTLNSEQKGKILTKLHEVSPLFDGSSQDLALVQGEINKIPSFGILRQITKNANEMKRILPALQEGIGLASSLSKIGPDLAGYKQDKRYLVLFLNNSELRPGGGFIGSYGIMTIKNGEITDFPAHDIYDIDNASKGVNATGPVAKYINPVLYMRDSNWSPDFPTSSETVLDFYKRESGDKKNIDGVIGITPNVIHDLLTLTGPITVPGYPYTFTSENFSTELDLAVEYNYYQAGVSFENRKKILGDLNKTILQKILSLPQDKWKNILEIVANNMSGKQIMLYPTKTLAEHDIIQSILSEQNWDGHIVQTDSDYLMVVDANAHSLKADPVVKRTIDYHVQLTNDGKPKVRLNITYQHTGFKDRLTDAYQTYTRVLAPKGSKLIGSKNLGSDVDTTEESGKTSFGFYKRIEPQTTQIVTLEYELPQSIAAQIQGNTYKLYVQKQLGAFDRNLNVTLQSPKQITGSEPVGIPFALSSNNEGTFQTVLSKDLTFTLHLQ